MDRLGPPPLNRQPSGLLDFFGIKNGGRYPEQLLSQLQPVLELGDHYEIVAALRVHWDRSIVADIAAGAFNIVSTLPVDLSAATGTLQVPQSEVWKVMEADLIWTFPAVANARFDGTYLAGDTTFTVNTWPMDLRGFTAGIGTHTRRGIATLTRPVWVMPGQTINLVVNECIHGGGANWAVSGDLAIVRMGI